MSEGTSFHFAAQMYGKGQTFPRGHLTRRLDTGCFYSCTLPCDGGVGSHGRGVE